MMILLIVFAVLYAILRAFYEVSFKKLWKINLLKKDYEVFHTFSFLINILSIFALGYFMINPISEYLYVNDIFYIALICGTIYWIIFDFTWGMLAHGKPLYMGGGISEYIFGNFLFYVKILCLAFTIGSILRYL